MLTTIEVLVVGTSILGALQVYASVRVLISSAYSGRQKLWQLLLVWLLPLVRAVFVLLFIESDSVSPAKRDTAFTASPGGNPEGVGVEGGHG